MYLGTLDEDGFATLSHESFVVYLRALVQDGLAHMCGVTWRAVTSNFIFLYVNAESFGICDANKAWI